MKRKLSTLMALERLASQESEFLASEFVAPRIAGQHVGVKIGQSVCMVNIRPNGFTGWGRFRPSDFRTAQLVRQATQDERDRYLQCLPAVRMLVAGRDDNGYLAVLAHGGDIRFQLATPARLNFAEGLELFDCVIARFDGGGFLYDGPDNRRSPKFADDMREALSQEADTIDLSGILPEERWLFAEVAKAHKVALLEERRSKSEYRIADALSHAGAAMRSYIERSDGFTVQYVIDGQTHSSFVDKDLRVRTAGICLSGHDNDYDLASLVSVIREGHRRSLIHRTFVDDDEDY